VGEKKSPPNKIITNKKHTKGGNPKIGHPGKNKKKQSTRPRLENMKKGGVDTKGNKGGGGKKMFPDMLPRT